MEEAYRGKLAQQQVPEEMLGLIKNHGNKGSFMMCLPQKFKRFYKKYKVSSKVRREDQEQQATAVPHHLPNNNNTFNLLQRQVKRASENSRELNTSTSTRDSHPGYLIISYIGFDK